jgi:hypothetical protein
MGYSYKDRTIGQNPPSHMPDTYQHGRILGKELRRKAREKIVKPFNSSPHTGSGLKPPGPDTIDCKEKAFRPKKPFIPSNPSKKGAAYELLSKVGRDYTPDPAKPVEVSFSAQQSHNPTIPTALALSPTSAHTQRHELLQCRADHAMLCSTWNTGRGQDALSPNKALCVQRKAKTEGKPVPFKPCAGIKERLSMHTVNPYQCDARPPPDLDFTLLP